MLVGPATDRAPILQDSATQCWRESLFSMGLETMRKSNFRSSGRAMNKVPVVMLRRAAQLGRQVEPYRDSVARSSLEGRPLLGPGRKASGGVRTRWCCVCLSRNENPGGLMRCFGQKL